MDSVMKQAREYLGFTLEEVAGAMGVAVDQLEAMESGRSAPAPEILSRLSRLYRREPSDLLKPGPDEVSFGPKPTSLEHNAKHLPPTDRVELAMFARFLGNKAEAKAK